MKTLNSPGVGIDVTDQSVYVGSGPGTIPLILIATKSDKYDPAGLNIAEGTTAAAKDKLYTITSQRDLVNTFGDPVFYSKSGTPINGYPLNEYGLLAAYSYLGISNTVRIARADIDLAQLEPMLVEPSSPSTAGTLWFDETASKYGLFERTGPVSNETWTSVTIKYVYNYDTGTTNTPLAHEGVQNDFAIVFQKANGSISYWKKIVSTSAADSWKQLGTADGLQVTISSVWPNITSSSTAKFWIKTTAAAQGANIVLRKMDPDTQSFLQQELPILLSATEADTYYASTSKAGKHYLKSSGFIDIANNAGKPAGQNDGNVLIFNVYNSQSKAWEVDIAIKGSLSVPTLGPAVGRMWFNNEVGLYNGKSTVDLLIKNSGNDWVNVKLAGFTIPTTPDAPTLYTQSSDPAMNNTVGEGDIWVDTDNINYPTIYRYYGSRWNKVDNADQTTPRGIIFADARPNPNFIANGTSLLGANNGGSPGTPDLDPDAPDPDLYPQGFLLWNTRYSSNNVKTWTSPYEYEGVAASPDNTNTRSPGTTGRWVTVSGNDASGVPYMGINAQNAMVVKALQSLVAGNENLRTEDIFFNLIAAPGYVELIDEMLALNDDRKNTAFVVGDTPFRLKPQATALKAWAQNSDNALGNGPVGLVSASKYFGVWYPSGYGTNTDGTNVVVPASHMVLRTIAYNDQVSYPWFAPAGMQRGIVNNVSTIGYVTDEGDFSPVRLSEGQRDTLYTGNVNPIRLMPQGGIVVYGQKTRQLYASATDRINVVRLENYLRYQFDLLAQPFLFEPNDGLTRKAVKNAFEKFMSEMVTLRAVYDFLIQCDTGNNTPARIDKNELWIDCVVAPTKAVEFIYIPIRIVNTGTAMTV